MKSDIEIAQAADMKHILEIAESIGLGGDHLELYGNHKAKVSLDVIDEFKDKPNGKYIDVTAITPTPLGEGKTVTTIGLSMALNKIGKILKEVNALPNQPLRKLLRRELKG